MVEPTIFGPHLWKSIHYIAIGAPKKFNNNDKQNYKTFFKNLEYWLPCDICSEHYKKNKTLLNINDYLESNETLFEYTFLFHNIVNKMLGKRELKYDEALKLYTSNPNVNSVFCIKNCIIFILLLIIIFMLLYILYILRKN